MPSHTCHIEILAESITYPDPDGEGDHGGSKGEIRLIKRRYADIILNTDKSKGVEPSIRILSDAESAEIDGR